MVVRQLPGVKARGGTAPSAAAAAASAFTPAAASYAAGGSSGGGSGTTPVHAAFRVLERALSGPDAETRAYVARRARLLILTPACTTDAAAQTDAAAAAAAAAAAPASTPGRCPLDLTPLRGGVSGAPWVTSPEPCTCAACGHKVVCPGCGRHAGAAVRLPPQALQALEACFDGARRLRRRRARARLRLAACRVALGLRDSLRVRRRAEALRAEHVAAGDALEALGAALERRLPPPPSVGEGGVEAQLAARPLRQLGFGAFMSGVGAQAQARRRKGVGGAGVLLAPLQQQQQKAKPAAAAVQQPAAAAAGGTQRATYYSYSLGASKPVAYTLRKGGGLGEVAAAQEDSSAEHVDCSGDLIAPW